MNSRILLTLLIYYFLVPKSLGWVLLPFSQLPDCCKPAPLCLEIAWGRIWFNPFKVLRPQTHRRCQEWHGQSLRVLSSKGNPFPRSCFLKSCQTVGILLLSASLQLWRVVTAAGMDQQLPVTNPLQCRVHRLIFWILLQTLTLFHIQMAPDTCYLIILSQNHSSEFYQPQTHYIFIL